MENKEKERRGEEGRGKGRRRERTKLTHRPDTRPLRPSSCSRRCCQCRHVGHLFLIHHMGFALATTPPLREEELKRTALSTSEHGWNGGFSIGHGQNIPLTCSRPEQGRTEQSGIECHGMEWNIQHFPTSSSSEVAAQLLNFSLAHQRIS